MAENPHPTVKAEQHQTQMEIAAVSLAIPVDSSGATQAEADSSDFIRVSPAEPEATAQSGG